MATPTLPDARHRAGTRPARPGLKQALEAPVDGASLSFFRFGLGLIVAWEAWRYLDLDRVRSRYLEPDFNFTFWPFDFVNPLPEPLMLGVFWVMFAAGLLLAVGLYSRVAAAAAFVTVSYIFLLEASDYLNHMYLLAIMLGLMVIVPANRTISADVLRRPVLREAGTPAWALHLIRFQLAVPYLYGGIAKLNGDWIAGEPLRTWLADTTDFPVLGPYFTNEFVVMSMVWGALALDLLIVPALFYRRTRPYAYAAAITFHLLNARLFNIGIFPWLMILATTIFLVPSWPRSIVRDLVRPHPYRAAVTGLGALAGLIVSSWLPHTFSLVHVAVGATGGGIAAWLVACQVEPAGRRRQVVSERRRIPMSRPLAGFLAVWVAVQMLVPFRHLAIPGNVNWTEEGHLFSWHMKLRDKQATAAFVVTDPVSGQAWNVDPEAYLTSRQTWKMAARPDLIVQFAHHLDREWREAGYEDVEVRVLSSVSLNGREAAPMIDPEADLSEVRRPWLPPADWILPLPG